ncbi:MAG TPA: hypothetical protein VGC56_00590 [Allosphingosinicella sp.]
METVDELLGRGVTGYSSFHGTLADAIAACTRETLGLAGLASDDIDVVILATESFFQLFDARHSQNSEGFREVRNASFDLFASLGINSASLFCATYGGCTNLLQALMLARAMVGSGLSRNVLIVAAERFGSIKSRLMDEAISIAGDGVATCIVNGDAAPGGFVLDHVGTAPYRKFQADADMASRLLEMFRAMKNAAADCYDSCCRQPADFKWAILGDYNKLTTLTYAKLLGFPPERTFLDNVGKMGHIPFDPLISLRDLQEKNVLGPSESILLFLCGPISCGSIALETV